MKIEGLDSVFYPHIILDIILDEFSDKTEIQVISGDDDNTATIKVKEGNEYTDHIYKIFDPFDEDDIIDAYNKDLLDAKFGVDTEAREYIDESKWLEDNGVRTIEECYPNYIFQELCYPIYKQRIFSVISKSND